MKNATVYDSAGRLTSITVANTADTILEYRSYTYTEIGVDLRDGSLRNSMTTETGKPGRPLPRWWP